MFASDIARYQPTISIMSFNIRYDLPEDGEDGWPHRREEVISFMQSVKPNLFGLQEPMPHQLDDFKQGLPEYESIGEARIDDDEYNPIFFNKSLFQLIDSGTFWLSDTPDKSGSKYDEAKLPRICTWAKLKWMCIPSNNNEFFLLNTHLDHLQSTAREKQMKVLVNFIKSNIPYDTPAILIGDFNGEDTDPCIKQLAKTMIFREASTTAVSKVVAKTFTGFDEKKTLVIDHIYYRGFQALLYGVLNDRRKNNKLLSDHKPIVCLFRPV